MFTERIGAVELLSRAEGRVALAGTLLAFLQVRPSFRFYKYKNCCYLLVGVSVIELHLVLWPGALAVHACLQLPRGGGGGGTRLRRPHQQRLH